jgi:hypothetical protein
MLMLSVFIRYAGIKLIVVMLSVTLLNVMGPPVGIKIVLTKLKKSRVKSQICAKVFIFLEKSFDQNFQLCLKNFFFSFSRL